MALYAQYHTPVQVLDDGGTVVGLVQLLPLVSVGSAVREPGKTTGYRDLTPRAGIDSRFTQSCQ